MQTNANQCKNDLFEEIEFQEIGEKTSEFGEFQQKNAFPVRVIEWEIPSLGETVKKEAKKFRVRRLAVWIGQAIAYVLVIIISLVLQLVWFFVCILWMALSVLFMSLFEGLSGGFMSGHGYRHSYQTRQRQDIDWRDIPTGWDAKGQAYVRKKMKERDRQRQGHVNNVNVNVNVNIENH